ncbi:MAG: hypothetical protein KatS3mg110_4335 [Pirellulaceae bacterium]|nr:MAG: hypothetical protein KatS3mg110_4335 [Pirellulaceae bacterium]
MPTVARRLGLVIGIMLMAGQTCAQEQSTSQPSINSIVARWRERQQGIRTIRASATVDVFCSKGYVTAKTARGPGSQTFPDSRPIPPEDTWFRDGRQSWAIDFAASRFRKEFQKARIFELYNVPAQIKPVYQLFLFNGRKHTWVIRPEEYDYPGRPPGFRQHVTFDHGPGYAFVIWPGDLPLFWCAGGTITGEWQNPVQMLKIDDASRFTLCGSMYWRNRPCVLLRVRNQQSTNSVVEFWVDRDSPHTIYRSQIVQFLSYGERVERQIDVEYKELSGQLVPANWRLTYFDYYDSENPQIFAETYTIQDIAINDPMAEELFTMRLQPGMGVYDADNNCSFVVDLDGKLVPYRNPEQQRRIAARARQQRTVRIAAPLIGVVALTVAAWFGYRYLRHPRRKNTYLHKN